MDELISYQDLKNHLLSISNREKRALFCLIYAAMAREGEIVRGRYNNSKPLSAEDIVSFPNKINILVRSAKTKRLNKFGKVVNVGKPVRVVPIFRNREAWLVDILEDAVKRTGTGPLFNYCTATVENYFKEWFPDIVSSRGGDVDGSAHTVHWLRGWRYSHYRRGNITGAPVESKVVALLGGWVNSSVPERYYDFTKIEDFEDLLENVF